MTNKVWVSRIMCDSTLVKYFDPNTYLEDSKKAVELMRRNNGGEPLPREDFPTEQYWEYPDSRAKNMPAIFLAGGFWTVAAACAEVLRGSDLGRSALYPVRLFQHDRKTPVEGDYFCLNFGERKEAFLAAESPKVQKPYPERELRKLSSNTGDDDVAVGPAALNGPDLWIDQGLWRAVFLSDRLVRALKAAKLTRRWGLRRCRVIGAA